MSVLLDVADLTVEYHTRSGVVRALEGLSFVVGRGEAVGLVGSSGSGKSTAALALLRLLDENARISRGRVLLQGVDLLRLSPGELRQVRGRRVGFVFQEPLSALNPVQRVGDQVAEVLRLHQRLRRAAAQARAGELLEQLGLH